MTKRYDVSNTKRLVHKRDGDLSQELCYHTIVANDGPMVCVGRACHGVRQPDREREWLGIRRATLEDEGEAMDEENRFRWYIRLDGGPPAEEEEGF